MDLRGIANGVTSTVNPNETVTVLRSTGFTTGALQQSINDFTTPGLAPSTIEAKGFAKPLIDTSHMLNSISYEVKK